MKTNLGSGVRIVLCAVFLCMVAVAQQPDYKAIGPVPSALLSAKSIFVSNAGSDSGLFPEPFSGDPSRAYSEFYTALKTSGQFVLAGDPSEADLVLELRLTAPYGPTNPNKQNGTADPRPMFRLTIYDRKTHYVLWTVTQSIEFAFLQKTHDRNFNDALGVVVAEFLQVAGRPASPAH
jgi:hypothetical protein